MPSAVFSRRNFESKQEGCTNILEGPIKSFRHKGFSGTPDRHGRQLEAQEFFYTHHIAEDKQRELSCNATQQAAVVS